MTAGKYVGISFCLLGIVLILVVAFMAITVLCIPKIVVKTAPKDIREIIAKRPDSSRWKTVIGIASAVAITVCILGILIWVERMRCKTTSALGLFSPAMPLLWWATAVRYDLL